MILAHFHEKTRLEVTGVEDLIPGTWLKLFRFGPVEWLWRTLTYARLQPLRRAT